jgi:hypothetical protein
MVGGGGGDGDDDDDDDDDALPPFAPLPGGGRFWPRGERARAQL